jgi:hypothetical protein
MENLFRKRATEYLRDDEAFLAIVSPESVQHYLAPRAPRLYDRLVQVCGSPGSGKTTISRLFEYTTIRTMLRNRDLTAHATVHDTLRECGAVDDEGPRILACRLAMETDYRGIWEFPYPSDLKTSLTVALIQARAVIAWIRALTRAGVDIDTIKAVPKVDADAALEAVGGTQAPALLRRAQEVEKALYGVVAALLPPPISKLDPAATEAYRPFDVIEGFSIGSHSRTQPLLPLVMLDDAHALHPLQFGGLRRHLARRELKVARWMLTRLDVMNAAEALFLLSGDDSAATAAGFDPKREIELITLQQRSDRKVQREAFRRMAKEMGDRYLSQMSLFATRNLKSLADLLSTEAEPITPAQTAELERSILSFQKKHKISESRRAALQSEADSYAPRRRPAPKDVALAMQAILLARYVKRTERKQGSLFSEANEEAEPRKPVRADSVVYDGALVRLLHDFERPYYYGIDSLCDASSENAETFLRLAGDLVDAITTSLIRDRAATLTARTQHKHITQTGSDVVNSWDFPNVREVRLLVADIGRRCRDQALTPNAWLGGGPNAFGIVQTEFDRIAQDKPELASVLQFAAAYNAFLIVRDHECQDRVWTLLELGGAAKVSHGLTLKRGGFVKGTIEDLESALREGAK